VRTVKEFQEGHVNGSQNIVLNTIPVKVADIKALNKKVIAVCRSGARSGQASSYLRKHGIDSINGGPWQNVAKFVK
jgi:rhodanese-related sulfurtransferase